MTEMPEVGLPKWPALLVTGEKVTPEQAAEILIRTDSHLPDASHASNTGHFDKALCGLFGVPYQGGRADNDPWPEYEEEKKIKGFDKAHWDALDDLSKRMKMIPLNYLGNSQVVSAWIGGPHGWVTWEGSVFSNNSNIGKWPDVEGVHEDWKAIAKAFPFLALTCQLLNGETCENAQPVVEYTVANGTVHVAGCESGYPPILPTVEPSIFGVFTGNPNREIGIDARIFEGLLKQVYGEVPQYKNKLYDEWKKRGGA